MDRFDPLASTTTTSGVSPPRSAAAEPKPKNGRMHQSPTAFSPEQRQYLEAQGFPTGMLRALHAQRQFFPVSFWILDNSSRMLVRDAHILRGNYRDVRGVTRWEELLDGLAYHADLSARLGLPTRYALLNQPAAAAQLPQYFSIHQTGNLSQEQHILQQILRTTGNTQEIVVAGPTPLTTQLRILREHLVTIAPQLRAQRQTATVVLATQGLPTNERGETSHLVVQEFVDVLRSLEALPVWIVLRMCTDDDRAFDFYNGLDAQIQLPFDVLDDWYGESLEVYLRNPWLTYALVLHRYREHGFRLPVLDTIDERALTVHEIRDLCHFLFDVPLPDPRADWDGFVRAVAAAMARERPHWNPVTQRAAPWIDLTHLDAVYGHHRRPQPQQHPFSSSSSSSSSYFAGPATATPSGAPSSSSSFARQQPAPQQRQAQQQQQPMYDAPQPTTNTSWTPQPASATSKPQSNPKDLVRAVEQAWAKQPPAFSTTKSIVELLGTLDNSTVFALVDSHSYFATKFHPFSRQALQSGGYDVVKRAVRKMRFFLHPDRLPKDLNEPQALLCRTLWDVISEAWDLYDSNNKANG